jgi:hypothetical protein
MRFELERKISAWLRGKDDRDSGRGYTPPRWVRESKLLERYYRTGYEGHNN